MALSEKTCETCVHWTSPSARRDFLSAVRLAWTPNNAEEYEELQNEVDKKYGICTTIDLALELNPGDPLPLAVTRDGSEYRATLFTQPEFGCALHKEAE